MTVMNLSFPLGTAGYLSCVEAYIIGDKTIPPHLEAPLSSYPFT
jgi:hypothetical protein